jgi:2-methylisocitrate lyase-like PEP mutase family enzyme
MPQVTKTEFKRAGVSHQIFANQGLRAAHKALEQTFGALSRAESSIAAERDISSVQDVAGSVGAQNMFALEARFRSNGSSAGHGQPRKQLGGAKRVGARHALAQQA